MKFFFKGFLLVPPQKLSFLLKKTKRWGILKFSDGDVGASLRLMVQSAKGSLYKVDGEGVHGSGRVVVGHFS